MVLSLILLISLYTLLAAVCSICPPDTPRKMVLCLIELDPGLLDDGVTDEFGEDPQNLESIVPALGNASPDTIEQLCREGKFHDAVECIDKAIRDCHESSLDKFKEIFDPIAFKASIGDFCNNTATYRAASSCLKENQLAMQHCVRQELREMQRASVTRTTDVDEVCRLKMMRQKCVNTILKSQCGDEIAELLKKADNAPLSQKCKAAKTGESFKVDYNPPPFKERKNKKIRNPKKTRHTTIPTPRTSRLPVVTTTVKDGIQKFVNLEHVNLHVPVENGSTNITSSILNIYILSFITYLILY